MTEPGFLREARVFYDAIAGDYAEMVESELEGKPLDRAMLDVFADRVRADGGGPVVDVGCGPGHVCAYLHARRLDVSGVDLSPEMVALARAGLPGLRFDEGTMTGLERGDGTLAGLLAWYSLIHVPPARHPQVIAEFHRVLRPGGRLLLAFQVGSEPLRLEEPFGHAVSLDFHRLSPDAMADLLTGAGFAVDARMVREAAGRERTAQGYLLARKS